MANQLPRPYMLDAEDGRFLESLGASIIVKATSDQTGGAFNLFEVSCPPGYATPLHVHYAEDAAVYVLGGVLTLYCGDEKKRAATGSFLYQPRCTPHGFRAEGTTPVRILYMTIPAGFDRFVTEQEMPAEEYEAETAAARYKIEVLGRLPE